MNERFQSVLGRQNLAPYGKTTKPCCEQTVKVAFILLKHFSLTSFSSAMDALASASLREGQSRFEVACYSLEGGPQSSDIGLVVQTAKLIPTAIDHSLVVVVGGHRVRLAPDRTHARALRQAATNQAIIAGLWNGAFHMADAGLLDGQMCYCHEDTRALITEYYRTVRVAETGGFAISGNFGSCSDATYVMELMLRIMSRFKVDDSDDRVEEIRRIHLAARPFEAPQKLGTDHGPKTVPKLLAVALALMEKHIEEPLAVEDIAGQVGVSRRQLERRFARYLGAGPNRYYMELRLTRARQLIVQSNRSLTEVAIATGFVSYPHFYKRFKEIFGVPPMVFRDAYELCDQVSNQRYAIASGF